MDILLWEALRNQVSHAKFCEPQRSDWKHHKMVCDMLSTGQEGSAAAGD